MFAEQTKVPVERSRAEIERVLTKYGCEGFGYVTTRTSAQIGFQAKGRMLRFDMTLPDRDNFKTRIDGRSNRPRELTPDKAHAAWELECRRMWRALSLAIKAKLECVESGISSFESEFLAHIVIPDGKGQTVGQRLVPNIEEMYQTKKMPKLLGSMD